jgi:hypothetical protein
MSTCGLPSLPPGRSGAFRQSGKKGNSTPRAGSPAFGCCGKDDASRVCGGGASGARAQQWHRRRPKERSASVRKRNRKGPPLRGVRAVKPEAASAEVPFAGSRRRNRRESKSGNTEGWTCCEADDGRRSLVHARGCRPLGPRNERCVQRLEAPAGDGGTGSPRNPAALRNELKMAAVARQGGGDLDVSPTWKRTRSA